MEPHKECSSIEQPKPNPRLSARIEAQRCEPSGESPPPLLRHHDERPRRDGAPGRRIDRCQQLLKAPHVKIVGTKYGRQWYGADHSPQPCCVVGRNPARVASEDSAAPLPDGGSLGRTALELRDRATHHEQRAKHFQLREIRLREGL